MLLPNAIQVILSSCSDHSKLILDIDSVVQFSQADEDVLSVEAYHEKWLSSDSYNTAEAKYVKRLLQYGLPEN